MQNKDVYFILSSACRLVKGLKRSVIIDYDRGDLYFISHDYMELIQKMDRQLVSSIQSEIEVGSADYFDEFLDFINTSETGFFTSSLENFPKISEEPAADDFVILMDVIIEVDKAFYKKSDFQSLCYQLSEIKCKDFQIRLLSKFDLTLLQELVDFITATHANHIEIHGTYNADYDNNLLKQFVEENTLIGNIFIYSAPEVNIIDVINEQEIFQSISLGKVYFIDYPFDEGNCCGVIHQENLNYSSPQLHNLLRTRNGCLDRKLTIDRYGNFKNCPSMKIQYGNLRDIDIKTVIEKENFRKYWFISKDQISTCKVCEFRYNCTDCRAFLQHPEDLYSKPLKCGYDPSTCKWEDWSENVLKEKEMKNKVLSKL